MSADANGWQPIASAPRDGTTFLTFTPGEPAYQYDLAQFDTAHDEFGKWGCGFQYCTHWMPLPAAPVEQ